MKRFFEEYGSFCLTLFGGILSLVFFFEVFANPQLKSGIGLYDSENLRGVFVSYEVPEIREEDFVVTNDILNYNDDFNPMNYAKATTSTGIDISNYISVQGGVDTNVSGAHEVRYTLRFNGKRITKVATFYVKEDNDLYVVEGTLVEGEHPLENQRVELWKGEDYFMASLSDSKGNFTFVNVPSGNYHLKVKGVLKEIEVKNEILQLGFIRF